MALPKVGTPTFTAELPSSGAQIKFRQFLVREEKVLLTAKESGDKRDVIEAFKTIVSNCVVGEVDVDSMPLFDLEYVFLMIRAKSQNNVAKLRVVDEEDKREYDAVVKLDEVRVERDEKHVKTIDLDGNVGVVMRYPSIRDLEELSLFDEDRVADPSVIIELIRKCIDSVYDSEDVYPMKDATAAEREEFFDSLSSDYVARIQEFFVTFPTVVGTIEYLKDGKRVSREVRGAANFLA